MTQVTLNFTGHVRSRMRTGKMAFAFRGSTLGELLKAFFEQYDVRELLLDEQDKPKPYARLVVNGRFSEFVGGLGALIQPEDTITLINPFFVM